ncbi:unnamed protein product [Clonostachys byssicola]|uniref:Uncharacterized protein n=1 Tax=Clonostachys byssicola TaxID=160290 RepID=A0A9N9Y8F4_9HYPO|nr:unnamed protein product [Clonostachys byssicola]
MATQAGYSAVIPPASRVPLDIWLQIAEYLVMEDDKAVVRAWLNVRHASRMLQTAIEMVFASQLLPATEIEFKVDSRGDYLDGMSEGRFFTDDSRVKENKCLIKGFVVRLDRFSPESAQHGDVGQNGRLAVFKANDFRIEVPCIGRLEGQTSTEDLERAWRIDIQHYTGSTHARIEITPHIIKLRGIVNDTELPDLEVDYEAHEVSFDWKHMFTKLLSEESLVNQMQEGLSASEQVLIKMRGTEQLNFLDLLEYQRMAWAAENCYSGTLNLPCQLCAAQGDIEAFGAFVRIKGQEHAASPKPSLPPSEDPNLPPHSDGQLLRCPTIWRFFRDVYSKLSLVRRDFPLSVARERSARRRARESRLRRWYHEHNRHWAVYEHDWVSHARILHRLHLVRLIRREEKRDADHDWEENEERLEWYSQSHTLPVYVDEHAEAEADEITKGFLKPETEENYWYMYGMAFDYGEDDDECLVM